MPRGHRGLRRRPRHGRRRPLRRGPPAAVRGRPRALRPRARVLLGGARAPGRRRLPQVADRARLLRLLRREPVPHRHGHRARRARLAARPQRPDRGERALHRPRLRRRPLLLGAERHLGVEPGDHVGLRRRRRDRALRPQLPQVDRAGAGSDRRHPGLPAPHPQPLRHHRADPAERAGAGGDRASAIAGQSAAAKRGDAARRPVYAVVTNCTYDGMCYDAAGAETLLGEERRSRSTSTRPGTATRASTRCTRDRFAMRGDPGRPPGGRTHGLRHPLDAQAAGGAVADLLHPRPRRPRRHRPRPLQRGLLHAGEHLAALSADRLERGRRGDDGRPGRAGR